MEKLRDGRYVLVRPLGEGSQGQTFEALDHGAAPPPARASARPGAYGAAENLSERWTKYVQNARTMGPPAAKSSPPIPTSSTNERLVAIKCFRVSKAKAWKDVELAEREARTLASLDHPHLPKYLEHFEEEGTLYLVMEKIEGESLAALRKKRAFSSATEVARMLEDIGEALRYLHGRWPLIVHRDIKPGNVIQRPDGSYALVDFGAVRDRLKPAGGSTVVGTFGYMAPEQFQGRASPKSDVYGLGATAITMLTGTEPEDLPHDGLAIDVDRAVPRGTPAGLVKALKAMLAPDPDRRVSTIDEALAFLKESPPRPPSREVDNAGLSRKERRRLRREEKRLEREQRKAQAALARTRRAPLFPRLIAHLVLFIASLVVWLVVGLVVPLLLWLLSLIFGSALSRAATSMMNASSRANARLRAARRWMSGYRDEPEAAPPKMRIKSELDQMKPIDQATALRIAIAREDARGIDPDKWIEERLAEEEALRDEERGQRRRRKG